VAACAATPCPRSGRNVWTLLVDRLGRDDVLLQQPPEGDAVDHEDDPEDQPAHHEDDLVNLRLSLSEVKSPAREDERRGDQEAQPVADDQQAVVEAALGLGRHHDRPDEQDEDEAGSSDQQQCHEVTHFSNPFQGCLTRSGRHTLYTL
jgi:hypothetical protein